MGQGPSPVPWLVYPTAPTCHLREREHRPPVAHRGDRGQRTVEVGVGEFRPRHAVGKAEVDFFAQDGEADTLNGGIGNNLASVHNGLDTANNVVLV